MFQMDACVQNQLWAAHGHAEAEFVVSSATLSPRYLKWLLKRSIALKAVRHGYFLVSSLPSLPLRCPFCLSVHKTCDLLSVDSWRIRLRNHSRWRMRPSGLCCSKRHNKILQRGSEISWSAERKIVLVKKMIGWSYCSTVCWLRLLETIMLQSQSCAGKWVTTHKAIPTAKTILLAERSNSCLLSQGEFHHSSPRFLWEFSAHKNKRKKTRQSATASRKAPSPQVGNDLFYFENEVITWWGICLLVTFLCGPNSAKLQISCQSVTENKGDKATPLASHALSSSVPTPGLKYKFLVPQVLTRSPLLVILYSRTRRLWSIETAFQEQHERRHHHRAVPDHNDCSGQTKYCTALATRSSLTVPWDKNIAKLGLDGTIQVGMTSIIVQTVQWFSFMLKQIQRLYAEYFYYTLRWMLHKYPPNKNTRMFYVRSASNGDYRQKNRLKD